jgi:hypothetical protein
MAYSTLPSVRSLVLLILFNYFAIFSICSSAVLVSSAIVFDVSCHDVISHEIWSTIRCSSWVTRPGIMLGCPVLGFSHVLLLPSISFSSLARCRSSSFIDSFGCTSSVANNKSSKSFVRMTRCPLVATSSVGTTSTQQSANFSNLVSQCFTRPNSS